VVALERRAPEARGRSERAFGILQDRLPKELQLAGISTVGAANRFLREVYLPEHNGRFAVPPEHPETAFVADAAGVHRDLLCVQEERTVGNDNTVHFRGLSLQIPPSPDPAAFRQGASARPRLPGRYTGHLPWPALPRPLPGRRQPARPRYAAGRLTPLSGRPPVDLWTSLRLAHQPHRPHHHSGQTMCYQHRSTSRAIDSIRACLVLVTATG
jgi:hypothetical protein